MRSRSVFIVTAGVVVAALFVSDFEDAPPTTAAPPEEAQPYLVPQEDPGPAFEPNLGQAPADVLFVSHAPGPDVALTPRGGRFRIPSGGGDSLSLELELAGARRDARVRGQDRRAGRSHYYRGATPAAWVTDVPHYGRVVYRDVYPGVDASFHGHEDGIEYDFLVRPGGDPASIRLRFTNARDIQIDDSGDVLIDTPRGRARQRAPFAFQARDGRRERVDARYRIVGRRELAFDIGEFDRRRELLIDPVLVFGTYMEAFNGIGGDVVTDAAGHTYVAGSTDRLDNGQYDAVVLKFAPNGQLLYRTQIGGFRVELGQGLALGAAGTVWLTGHTWTPDTTSFPRTTGAYQTAPGGGQDAYFLQLGAGGELLYSSLFGGSGTDSGESIAVGAGGEIYIAGTTNSVDLPVQSPLQPTVAGGVDFFIAKLDASATTLVYSTYLGGSGDERWPELQVDAAGRAFLVGTTGSADFPAVNPIQAYAGGQDGVFARLDASGTLLQQSTHVGGSADDDLRGLALDATSGVYVTGMTASPDLPVRDPIKAAASRAQEGFLCRITEAGLLSFSTYLDRNGGDDVAVVLRDGSLYLTGDSILAKVKPDLTGYQWFFGLGVGASGWKSSVALHADGGAAVVSTVGSGHTSFPTHNQTISRQPGCADCDHGIVVARVADAPVPALQHEQDASAVTYTGTWSMEALPDASGGSVARSSEAGATFEITFNGTGIQVFGRRGPSGGSLHGTHNADLNLRPATSLYRDHVEPQALLFSLTGLNNGTHRMTFAIGGSGSPPVAGDVWFDGFNVLTSGPMPTATPPPSRPTWAPTVTPQPGPTATPTPAWTRVESHDARVVYQGNWYVNGSANHSAGSARLSMDPGDTAALTFDGTSIRWIGARDQWSGVAKVYVDSNWYGLVHTNNATEQTQVTLFELHNLAPGTHTIRVEVVDAAASGFRGAWVWIDAFEVGQSAGPTATPRPTARPTAGPTPTPTRAPRVTPTPTGAPTPGTTRIEDGDSRIAYAGTWHTNASPNANHSGGTARLAGDAGDTATLTFNGTGVKWQGLKDPWAGIARVYVDGTLRATVDTYSAVEQLRQTLFTLDGLAAGTHTIRIEVTGTRNPSSGAAWIWVDAFDVTNGGAPPTATPMPTATASPTAPPRLTPTPTPTMAPTATPTTGPTPSVARIEDGDSRIVYAGTWHTNASPSANHSGGTSRLSGEPGVTATLTFTGTGVAWNGLKDPWAGIARVYIDGTLRATVDTYSAVEQLRQVLFSANALGAGSHTVRVEVTGTRHPSSGGDVVWVDAFDVTP
jgi:hypothetical protein